MSPGSSDGSNESRRSSSERRAAAQAVRQQQVAAERRRRTLLAGGGILVVLIVLGVLVGIGLSQKSTNKSGPSTTASTSVTKAVSSVPASVFDTIGAGAAAAKATAKTTPLTRTGTKPRILYVGAEWCPFCGAQRWVLAVALSRFGTFSHLGVTESSSSDVYPSTQTLSFRGSTYTSPYVDFAPFEVQDNQRNTLDTLSAADQSIFQTYGTGFPFIDIDGKYLAGVMFDPGVLHTTPSDTSSGPLSRATIIAALNDPSSPIAQAIDGAANAFSATICKVTNNQPASVCQSAGVRAAS